MRPVRKKCSKNKVRNVTIKIELNSSGTLPSEITTKAEEKIYHLAAVHKMEAYNTMRKGAKQNWSWMSYRQSEYLAGINSIALLSNTLQLAQVLGV